MIVPSIDIMNGRAVQLRRGKELVLDGGDPIARLEEFAIAGEVDRLWDDALAWAGRIDVLVNNAAVMRLDGGMGYAGAVITPFYDSLLVKVTASAPTFENALQRMDRALREFRIRRVARDIRDPDPDPLTCPVYRRARRPGPRGPAPGPLPLQITRDPAQRRRARGIAPHIPIHVAGVVHLLLAAAVELRPDDRPDPG